MTKFNLLEHLQPLTLEELSNSTNYDHKLSNLLKSVATESPNLSNLINVDLNYIESIRTLHLHLYNLLPLNKKSEDIYVSNLPSDEKKIFNQFRDIMRNLSVIQESEKIKLNFSQIGENNFSSNISRRF